MRRVDMAKPLSPKDIAALSQLFAQATALHRQNQLADAERIYARILKADPVQFETLQLLAQLKMQTGKAGEALRLIGLAVKAKPSDADAHAQRGMVLRQLGQLPDALASFEKALALQPDHLDARGMRGDALMAMGRHTDALADFDAVLSASPDHVDATISRGVALGVLGRHADALIAFDRVLARHPHPAALYNRGNALADLGRHDEAVTTYERVLAVAPDHAKALNSHGKSLQALNRHHDALASFDKALALTRDYADAHFNKAMSFLTLGDYPRGFAEYEWRWRRTGMPKLKAPGPLWLGEFPVGGKTILLTAEQGLGDAIQFARYATSLAQDGATVILEVQPELKSLLARIDGVAAVTTRGDRRPAFDLQCPLASLPLARRTAATTVPAGIPYLSADLTRLERWRMRLVDAPSPRIALVWAGNASHPNDANRSITFSQLAPLWPHTKASFISLQRDVREADRATLAKSSLLDLASELGDFEDTAAVLSLCDLVITVDTSVAHLAGALGRPLWLLVPFVPDWRWGLAGQSPWYPAARLFRQNELGDWDGVVRRVAAALNETQA